MNAFKSNWPIIFRASLYALAAAIPEFCDKFKDLALSDKWPSTPRLAWMLGLSAYAAIIAVRAFYDGAAQRHKDSEGGKTDWVS